MAVCAKCLEPVGSSHLCERPKGSILRYFEFSHLPPKLQHVSRHFYTAAEIVSNLLPDGPEKSVCLRKLLEAKDAAVRAALDLPDV